MKKSKISIASILSFEPNESLLRSQLSDPKMDWEWLVKSSSQQGVMTSAYCRLKHKNLIDVLPNDLNTYLSEITNINRNRNQSLLDQVKELSHLFNTHKIHHVFVKGCALLASGVYNDIGERMIGDIDVLVEPTHLHKAGRLLKETNYTSLDESLFGKYKDHRHLPRLIHPDRLGAVEIHSKLLRTERRKILNIKEILANRRTIKDVCVPTIETNLDILILNHQINDFGYLFKSINLKACYDSLALEQQNEPSIASKTSKYHRLFYTLRALNFKPFSKTSKNTSSTVLKKMYKYLNKKGLVNKIHTRLVNVNIGLITGLEGVKLFAKNKHFRADVWTHKSEVIKLFRAKNSLLKTETNTP